MSSSVEPVETDDYRALTRSWDNGRMPKEQGRKLIAQNRKARHDYHVEDTWEAGLVLMGTEVKSLRQGRATLVDGFAEVDGHEVWLHGVHIPEYTQGTWTNHAARRRRKLLLNRAEIDKIERKIGDKGYTLVPLALYFKDGRAKVEIGLAKGKKTYDKRHALAERQAEREKQQAIGRRAQGPHRLMVDRRSTRGVERRVLPSSSGLPGLFDVHTHFLPPRVMAKVRRQFDNAGPLIGRPWPLEYRGDDEALVETLRGFGVRRFSALAYAHRPGMAEFLNDWAAGFAERVPELSAQRDVLPRARRRGVRRGAGSPRASRSSRCTCRWAASTSRDPLLDRRRGGMLEDAGTPVVIHAGSGPVGNAVHRAGADRRAARSAPAAGAGGRPPRRAGVRRVPDAGRDATSRSALDTTMVFTRLLRRLGAAFPADLLPRLRDLRPKVLLGSDFPNIPYPYARPARRAGPPRPRRRLAPCGVLGATASACSGSPAARMGMSRAPGG